MESFTFESLETVIMIVMIMSPTQQVIGKRTFEALDTVNKMHKAQYLLQMWTTQQWEFCDENMGILQEEMDEWTRLSFAST